MSESKTVTSGGIGVFGLLGVVFIVLKLAGITQVAAWSWWWVLAPFWIPWAIAGAVLALAFIIALCVK